MREVKTARLWVCHPETGAWIKIGLQDNQSITIGGRRIPHDEGWSSHADTYTRRGNEVILEVFTDGRDCDGRLTMGHTETWTIGGELYMLPEDTPPPVWTRLDDAYVRDEYAEQAGY